MPATGLMRDRYAFQAEGAPVGDADQGVFETRFTCAAATLYLRGGEAVQDQRLQGRQPVVLTIRVCAAARLVDNAWRAVDARDTGRVFDITGVEPNRDLGFLDVLAVRRVGQDG